jgi:DNA-binding NarL/FixJ family response regulator
MTGGHRPKRDSESQTTPARRADLTRGEIGVGAASGPTPPTDTWCAGRPLAEARISMPNKMIGMPRIAAVGASSHSVRLRAGDGPRPVPTAFSKPTSREKTGPRHKKVAPRGAAPGTPSHNSRRSGEPATDRHGNESTTPIPLVVIDDHPIVHTGIRHWLAKASIPTDTVSAYGSVAQFLNEHKRRSTTTAVIIYDPEHGEQRPDYAGLQQLCELKHRVVAYSRIASAEIILNCLDAGATNYIVKTESPQHLIDAITAAQRGAEDLGPLATAAVQAAQQHGRPELTDQETRVLIAWLLADNKDGVSQQLHIAPSTVRTHLQRIRRRYREINRPAPSKAALFARALQDGLLGIHDV